MLTPALAFFLKLAIYSTCLFYQSPKSWGCNLYQVSSNGWGQTQTRLSDRLLPIKSTQSLDQPEAIVEEMPCGGWWD